jgi:two-component system LytT family response regulator
MRAVVVDDEPLAREGVKILLEENDIEIVGEAGNGGDALALVDLVKPDLLLVDVQMPGMTGLELAAALPPGVTPAIVFVTAHDEFALRAFDVHALDYVLKPIDDRRFAEAIRRARTQHELGKHPRLPRPTRLSIRDGDSIVFVPVDEIDWIEAADYYVEIHAGGRSYLMRETMQRLQEQLDERFVRIHRSRLVNRDRVRELRTEGRGETVAILDGGVALRVARSCRAKLVTRG